MNWNASKWRWPLAALLVAVAGTVFWWRSGTSTPSYATVAASRGDLVRTVIATGAVNPVATVQVGTYVSGVIQELHCDYNTRVSAGQTCAKIDPRPYQVVFDQAAANLASARAQLRKDEAALAFYRTVQQRDLTLLKNGGVSREAVDTDKNNVDQAVAQIGLDEAAIQQRQAALDAAQVNLDYTNITSPVDGVVVSRSIDVGQTVAASFQTPTLFLIAKDLTKMQVDTNVSESDVGETKVGQNATFSVEAWPDKTFAGSVTQLRQAPITVQNVVTYDVVVGVDNPDLQLLPGMTANVRITTDERHDALRVPLQALRFTPKSAARAEKPDGGVQKPERGGAAAKPASSADATKLRDGSDASKTGRDGATKGKRSAEARVWVLRADVPTAVPVTTGISDGALVEITGGELAADDDVIVAERSDDKKGGGAPPPRSPVRF